MKLRSLGAVGLGLLVGACGANKDALVGNDSNKHVSTDGGTGGAGTSGGGASQSTGGSVASGAAHGSGGSVANGGAAHGSGGSVANGGAAHGTGGSMQPSGGATHSTGGSAGGIKCGTNTCAAGEYCCNSSCGVCAPMGAACIQIACDPPPPADAGPCIDTVACIKGTVWSPTQCKCVPTTTGGTCTTAADCHLVSNYCDGCNCLSLTSGQKEPTCSGTTVQCLVDPCSTKSAACVGGHCVAQ